MCDLIRENGPEDVSGILTRGTQVRSRVSEKGESWGSPEIGKVTEGDMSRIAKTRGDTEHSRTSLGRGTERGAGPPCRTRRRTRGQGGRGDGRGPGA